jgi:Fungal Zn(2)-Cys(6) binuclear cluster domain
MSPKRTNVTTACDRCRAKKICCDNLPTCINCANHKLTCVRKPPNHRGPKPGFKRFGKNIKYNIKFLLL